MNPQEFKPQEREEHQPVVGGSVPPQPQNPGAMATGNSVEQNVVSPSLPSNQQPITPSMPQPPQDISSQPQQAAPVVSPVPQAAGPAFMQPTQQQTSFNTKPPKRSKRGLFILILVLLFLAFGGLAAAYLLKTANPEKLLQEASVNSLSVNSYQEKNDLDTLHYTVQMNSADPTAPQAVSVTTITDSTVSVSTYATSKDTFVKVDDTNKSAYGDRQALLGQWAQTRKDGVSTDATEMSSPPREDPRSMLLGQLVMGNFTAKDDSLKNYLSSHPVYSLKEGSAKTISQDGKKVVQMDITINTANLVELNKKAAKIMGITFSDTEVEAIKETKQATVYVDQSSKLFKRVVTKISGESIEVVYSGYNETTVQAAPTATADAKAVTELMVSGLLFNGADLSQQAASEDLKFQDSQRQVDVVSISSQLEAYYAMNGYYPLFSQLNNPTWVASNIQGLPAAALTDPEATSPVLSQTPAVHIYAYQPAGCDTSGCTSFTVTATLNDGSVFSKSSL